MVPAQPRDLPGVVFQQVARASTGCLAYLVGDAEAGEALVVDPPFDTAEVEAAARAAGLRIAAVMDTHTHADHRSGARALAQREGARLLLPAASKAAFPHEAVAAGRDVRVGDVRLRAVATPGHTADAMSLLLPDRALVGDTLLVRNVGRADFYDGGILDLYHSLFDQLLTLDDAVQVYPGHFGGHHGLPPDRMTTLGDERRLNEALSLRNLDDFVRYMTEGWPPKPSGWEAQVAENLRG